MDNLKTLQACKDICLQEEEGPLSENCIDELVEDMGLVRAQIGTEYCLDTTNVCEIIDTDQFRSLLLLLIRFLQFVYSVRSQYGNAHDNVVVPPRGQRELIQVRIIIG